MSVLSNALVPSLTMLLLPLVLTFIFKESAKRRRMFRWFLFYLQIAYLILFFLPIIYIHAIPYSAIQVIINYQSSSGFILLSSVFLTAIFLFFKRTTSWGLILNAFNTLLYWYVAYTAGSPGKADDQANQLFTAFALIILLFIHPLSNLLSLSHLCRKSQKAEELILI